MTNKKKFKRRVRALKATEGISYTAAFHRLSVPRYYRTRLIITTSDGTHSNTEVMNLSSFPRTGDIIALADGRKFLAWHPVVKASMKPMTAETEDIDRPAVLVYAVTEGCATVRQVSGGVHAPPVYRSVSSDLFPQSVLRYVTRELAERDGVDLEMPDPLGPSMFGHHVYRVPAGLVLKREQLDVEYEPRLRYCMPSTGT